MRLSVKKMEFRGMYLKEFAQLKDASFDIGLTEIIFEELELYNDLHLIDLKVFTRMPRLKRIQFNEPYGQCVAFADAFDFDKKINGSASVEDCQQLRVLEQLKSILNTLRIERRKVAVEIAKLPNRAHALPSDIARHIAGFVAEDLEDYIEPIRNRLAHIDMSKPATTPSASCEPTQSNETSSHHVGFFPNQPHNNSIKSVSTQKEKNTLFSWLGGYFSH